MFYSLSFPWLTVNFHHMLEKYFRLTLPKTVFVINQNELLSYISIFIGSKNLSPTHWFGLALNNSPHVHSLTVMGICSTTSQSRIKETEAGTAFVQRMGKPHSLDICRYDKGSNNLLQWEVDNTESLGHCQLYYTEASNPI